MPPLAAAEPEPDAPALREDSSVLVASSAMLLELGRCFWSVFWDGGVDGGVGFCIQGDCKMRGWKGRMNEFAWEAGVRVVWHTHDVKAGRREKGDTLHALLRHPIPSYNLPPRLHWLLGKWEIGILPATGFAGHLVKKPRTTEGPGARIGQGSLGCRKTSFRLGSISETAIEWLVMRACNDVGPAILI